ncbi:hypothetical protein Tco_0503066 [Tanacetum coccineum]
MFSRCLTTRVTGYDQPAVHIMQMLYYFVNNIHVDYVELLWEGFHYSLKNLTTLIPYPRFTKLIVSHYITAYPEISRRDHNRYHNLADDVMIKSIFNSGKNKETVEVTSSPFKNDDNQVDLDTRLEPRSDKESPEVKKIADISLPVNVIKEEEESVEDDYELRRREKGKYVEEIRNTPSLTTIRSPRIPTNLVSSNTEKLQELTKTDTLPSYSTPSSSSPKSKISTANRLLSLFNAKPGRFRRYKSFFQELQGRYDSSEESMGTFTTRVILFGIIPTSIPATVPIVDTPVVHDDTPLIPTETPTIPPVISTLPHTSPFLYTDLSDSDTSKRPL